MTEPKIKIVSPPTASPDELAAAAALGAEGRDMALSDFSFPGALIEPVRERQEWVRLMGKDAQGNAITALLDDLPLVPDVWSYICWWECWKPAGDDGKNKKTAQIGPLRRVDGILPPLDQLPDRDESLWELTKDGKRKRDPWGRRNGITLKNPRNGDRYFWRSGYEGNQTLSALFVLYASNIRARPGAMPEVKLGFTKSYNFKGEPETKPALIPTGEWSPYGEGQSPPPMPTKATMTTLVKAREKGRFAEDASKIADTMGDEIPF